MVLQRSQPIVIMGNGEAGSDISLEMMGQKIMAKTSKEGEWKATFPSQQAGGPHTLIIKSNNEQILLFHYLRCSW